MNRVLAMNACSFRALNRVISSRIVYKTSTTLLFNNAVNVNGSQKRFAGHAKWQNIASTKSKTDSARQKLHSSFAFKVRKAVREGGGTDPKSNTILKAVIEEAKRLNVRKEVIDRAIERMENVKIVPHIIEAIGPGGCFLIISCETDNVSILRGELKKALKKFKCGLASTGAGRFAFREKGFIRIAKKNAKGEPLTFDKMEDLAIEAGGEEITEEKSSDENGETNDDDSVWLITTAGEDLYSTKHYFEQNAPDVEIISAEIEFTPADPIKLTDNDLELLSQATNQLEEVTGVLKVYNNVK